jgi:glucose/arabinose dehydrogenase
MIVKHLMKRIAGIASGVLLAGIMCLSAQSGIRVERWINGVTIPVDIAHSGDDRLFVVEKPGRVRIIRNNTLLPNAFLDIRTKVRSSGNEQGLLGLAFHPQFRNNGLIYVNYTSDSLGPNNTLIEEYRLSNDTDYIDHQSGRVLLVIKQPFGNHNGGCLKFGPDGFLYIGMGDGGSADDPNNNGQNKLALLGKMLRIDVNAPKTYNIPPSNPFVNKTEYAPEIWALGMRNPWRFSFDRLTGDLWIGDVGQGTWEEIDFEAAGDPGGRNYGWRCYEGNANFNLSGCEPKENYTFPIHEYLSDERVNGCSVTGGFVCRGEDYPSLYGKYLYADYCSGKMWTIEKLQGGGVSNALVYDHANNAVTTFGEDAQGNLYFADATASAIFRIYDTCNLAVSVQTQDESCPGYRDGSAKTEWSDQPGVLFEWSTGDTTGQLQGLASGNYSVTITRGLCRATAQFEISGAAPDTACTEGFPSISICDGDSTTLVACDAGTNRGYAWFRNDSLLPQTGRQLTTSDPGNYRIRWIDSSGCLSEPSGAVEVKRLPLPPKPGIGVVEDSVFSDPGYALYRWIRFGQVHEETILPYVKVGGADGYYSVLVIDSNGCTSPLSDSIYVVRPASDNPETEGSSRIIPNPVKDQLCIHTDLSLVNWEILDLSGRSLSRGKFTSGNTCLGSEVIGLLAPGSYWLQLNNGKGSIHLAFTRS